MDRNSRFSADRVAEHLINRMSRAGEGLPRHGGGSPDHGAGEAGTDVGTERQAARLADLIVEKEDLLRQIASDAKIVDGAEESISQGEVLRLLDDLRPDSPADLRRLPDRIRSSQGLASSIRSARERVGRVSSMIGELMADERVSAAYRKRLTERINVIRSARNIESLRETTVRCDLARLELLAHRLGEDVTLTAADNETVRTYDVIRRKAEEKINSLMSDPEVYYEAKRRTLLEYRRQLVTSGYVETEGIKRDVMQILSHLQLGTPVFLRGHLGAGKTETALHVSRTYLGSEPEFISGSEEATKYDIYGKTQIGVRPEADRIREFRTRINEYRRYNPEAGGKELKEVERQYYEAIVVRGQTTSFFQYGPLIRALRDGKPLIIDEMDGIPHSILMRLNHVLTRRVGGTIDIQESGGDEITVRRGFCVLATGNIKSERYKREELDAAFLSRWWSHDVTYPSPDETYQILVASLIDRRGNLEARGPGDLQDLKRLTQAASEIQRIFTGDHLDYLGEGADAARGRPAGLKKSVLSMRNLWNIVRPWKAHNFDRPLETYILNEFIRPSVTEDQVYLVQLFCRFRFFKNWRIGEFGIPGLTESKLIAFQGKQPKRPQG